MIYSFDVYDTLITRVAAEPGGVFVYMRKIMSDSGSYGNLPTWFVDDFVRIRKESESLARIKAGDREITLTEIYRQMSDNHSIPEDICNKISELEMNVEIQSSVAIQENIDKLEQLSESGERVLLISDMYMDRAFFERLFAQVYAPLNQYPLYISSEKGATKSSGKLFALAAKKEQIPLTEWTHIGDNSFSDVDVPNLLGIKTNLFQKKKDTVASGRIDAILPDKNSEAAQYLTGIQNHNSFLTGSIAYQIGYSLSGMILYEYVKWVLYQVEKMGIEALHFIARDGFLLKQIADILIAEEKLPIRTNYLYGSRKAWRTTVDTERELAVAYLRQEALDKGESFAFVDVQGTGLSLDMLPRLTDEKIPIFYYTSPMNYKSKNTEPHIYSVHSGRWIIEAFCRAPHGRTIGYAEQGSSITPLITQVSNRSYMESLFNEYAKGVVDFVKEVLLFQDETEICFSFADAAYRGMKYCENTPDRQLADYLGEVPSGLSTDDEEFAYAPILTEQDIKRIEFDRRKELLHHAYKGVNLEYSYRRLELQERKKVDEYQKAYYEQTVNKRADAIHVAIVGCGQYGRELYRSLYLDETVIVEMMTDPYPDNRKNTLFNVEPISNLKGSELDYVIISEDYKKSTRAIKVLLALAGLDAEKVISETAFRSGYCKQKV